MGGLLSGILGGGSSGGQQQQMQALKASQEDIQRYRPEAMQARLNALGNMTSAFQGSNNALETLWGDPNAPKVGQGPSGPPQRMMGHDLPQQPMGPGASPQGEQQFDLSNWFSPLNPLRPFGGK